MTYIILPCVGFLVLNPDVTVPVSYDILCAGDNRVTSDARAATAATYTADVLHYLEGLIANKLICIKLNKISATKAG
jgi:hypothetical protein